MPDLTTNERPVRMVFTSRAGGASIVPYESFNLGDHVGDDPANVQANRKRLASILGLPVDHLTWMEQLHTNTVTVVSEIQSGPVPATDALVTTVPGLALCVLTADCVPVLLADHHNGVAAAVHAGRLGARNGILRRTVEKMVELGADVGSIQAVMGPAASGRFYEVPEAMARDVESTLPGSYTRTDKGTVGLDLRAGLLRQLFSLGVVNVESDPRCTIEDEQFFSYRREGTTGRQASVVWLNGGKNE